MARRNLKYQFLRAINKSFREIWIKYSNKVNGIRNTVKIYSYSSRSNLIDLSANFANYMRVKYPEVYKVSKIQTEHIQGFLKLKNREL